MHPPTTRPERGPVHTRPGRGRHRGIAALVLTALACLAGVAAVRLSSSPPGPALTPPAPVTPAGTATPARHTLGPVSWPADGVSAADVGGFGVVAGPGATRPVPIASVAKVMTAYVILRDHPLAADEPGPDIDVLPSEAAAYPDQDRDGDSLVPVAAGEVLTERQALEALLLPSADNMAWILARWDADDQDAFLDRMNGTARGLGMTATRYTDPSGLDPATTSTAADQVRLAAAAMGVPALAAIAALSEADVPVAGLVRNYNTLLGQDGIAGLKTGSTSAAGGCVLLAAWAGPNGHRTLVVAAVFGQPGTAATILPNALQAGHDLVLALDRALGLGTGVGPGPGPDPGQEGPPAHRLPGLSGPPETPSFTAATGGSK
jgi:serine-type D-Ala-D-Ala carboxypeptidase (penicillin-binding protein 5/6)